jgi:putative ABC transport system permease protein
VTASTVSRRKREIGIRIAIGAAPSAEAGRILKHAVVLAALGLAAGIVPAFKLAQLATPLLRETSPGNALIWLTVAASLLSITGIAALLPASRAARIDPAATLRSE